MSCNIDSLCTCFNAITPQTRIIIHTLLNVVAVNKPVSYSLSFNVIRNLSLSHSVSIAFNFLPIFLFYILVFDLSCIVHRFHFVHFHLNTFLRLSTDYTDDTF
eukprot:UN27392